jgi:glycosidase
MKRIIFLLQALVCFTFTNAQLLSWSGDFPKDNDNVSITLDAALGNLAMLGHTQAVYVHTGVITSASSGPSDWRYVKFTWGTANAAAQATSLGGNKWRFDIANIRAFYGVPAGESIVKIAILFRDALGNKVHRNADGSDMYIPIFTTNVAARFTNPLMQPMYIPIPEPVNKQVGDAMPVTAIANQSADMRLLLNGTQVQSTTGTTTISASPTLTTAGSNKVVVEAIAGGATFRDSFSFFVATAPNVAALPNGVREGINYAANNTEATLVLFAPNKGRVCIIGDLPGASWQETTTFQMNKTPDGKYWWRTVSGLTPGTEYSFQYLVNGTLKIGDPYCQKVLDPWNDSYITSTTYPNLKPYPTNLTTGVVSILQTNEPAYTWNVPNFSRPNKKGLVVYELLLRDFVAAHDFKTLRDTLTYLKRLGVNAIEIMPFNEFEGNESWGYNPSYYFAPDKYYGPKNTVKQFIDAAHQNGIAVIMDMTLNHVFGTSPQARLYWDASNNRPASDNPWLNPIATHPFSVGYDFNHTKDETKYLVDRVIEHWLTEYKIDGFRWDLSKGFTQRQCADVACWNNYDADRVVTWKRIYDKMQTTSSNSYCILEHLGGNQEEIELANHGMMLWGKETDPYNEMTMGFVNNSNFQGVIHNARNWSVPHLVGYAESHDEERTMFKNVTYGNNSNTNHNVRLLATALQRNEMLAALLLTIPGPKMFWQFAELGYDYSINTCPNTTLDPACRTDKKPIRWDYYNNANRKKLFDVYAALNNLRLQRPSAFTDGSIQWGTGGLFKWITVNHGTLKLVVVANMDVQQHTGFVAFPSSGTYYDYLLGNTFNSTGGSQSFTLAPGEYHVYVDQQISNGTTPIFNIQQPILNMNVMVYPNPIVNDALVEYDLPENGKVNISILDLQGRQQGILYSGHKLAGTHQFAFNSTQFDVAKLSSGIYLLQFDINGKKKVEKIVKQ